VSTPRPSRESRSLAHWGAQAHVAVAATGRRFAYRWTAPRSPALRALTLPLFLGVGLVLLVLAMLVLAAILVVAAAAVVVFAIASGIKLVAARIPLARRGQPRNQSQ
jgi:uncharacterized membrane protein